jgi:hypothetical protein
VAGNYHGEERRSRWQDDRIDDLASLARSSDHRLDSLQNLVAVHDIQLTEIQRDKVARANHGLQWRLMLAGVVLTLLASLVTTYITIQHSRETISVHVSR